MAHNTELDINIVKGFLRLSMEARGKNSFRNICEMNQTRSIFRLMMFWFAVNAINVFATKRFALKASFQPWHHRPSTELIYVRVQIATNMTLNSLLWGTAGANDGKQSNSLQIISSRHISLFSAGRFKESRKRQRICTKHSIRWKKFHFELFSVAFALSQKFFNNVWRKFIKCCYGKQTSLLCVMNSAKFFPMFKTAWEILEKS